MPKRTSKRSYSRAFSRSRSRSKSSRYYKAPTKKVKRSYSRGRKLGGMLGSMAGSLIPGIGTSAGKALGKAAGSMISSVFGSGDYYVPFNVSSNSLLKLSDGTTPPQFGHSGRTTSVKHREYITDILSSTGFAYNNYAINPGQQSTFPWLSTVAVNYECYRIKGMLFEYKSMSADALTSTNTALGTVIMATQYNAASDPFSSKQQMENYEFAQSCKPSCSMMHYIECAKSSAPLSELYIRIGQVPPGQSIQLYDLGEFYISTQGMQQAGVTIGELWVTYDIELFKPKLIAAAEAADLYWGDFYGVGLTSSTWLGSAIARPPNNTIRANLNTNGSIQFTQKGLSGKYFEATYTAIGLTSAAGGLTTPSFTNALPCLFYDTVGAQSNSATFTSITSSANLFTWSICFKITDDNAVVTYPGTYGAGVSAFANLKIKELPQAFVQAVNSQNP